MKNIANKIAIILLSSSAMVLGAESQTKSLEALQKQIAEMKKTLESQAQTSKKLKVLENKIKLLETSHKAPVEKIDIKKEEVKKQSREWPKGYIEIPTTDTAVKFGGFIKTDFIYDANAVKGGDYAGDLTSPQDLPIKGIENAASKSGHFNAHARGTRFNMEVLRPTNKGDIKTFVEIDFLASEKTTPRIRHLYGEFGGFLVGQTGSNFQDMGAIGEVLDSNAITGAAIREPQIRYTAALSKTLSLAVAAERPKHRGINITGSYNTTSSAWQSSTGSIQANNSDGTIISSLPDLTANLKWTLPKGYISLRALGMRVGVKTVNGTSEFAQDGNAWGLGISGKLSLTDTTNIFGQLNGGKGAGHYIYDASSNGVLYVNYPENYPNSPNKIFHLIKAYNAIIGLGHKLTDKVRTNLVFSHTGITQPTHILSSYEKDSGNLYNTKLQKLIGNIVYSPIEKVDVGFELAHLKREVVRIKNQEAEKKHATGTRAQVVVFYRF